MREYRVVMAVLKVVERVGIAFLELSALEKIVLAPISLALAEQRASRIVVHGRYEAVVIGDNAAHVALIILDIEIMPSILVIAHWGIDAVESPVAIFVVAAIFIGGVWN